MNGTVSYTHLKQSMNEMTLSKGNEYFDANELPNLKAQIKEIESYNQFIANSINVKWIVNIKEIKTFKDKNSFGKIKKLSDLDKSINGYDYIITLNYCFFQMVELKHQMAILDDLFCRISIDEDDKGDIKYTLRKHDVQEFAEVIKRHGLYMDSLTSVYNVMSNTVSTNEEDTDNEIYKEE